MTQDFGHYEVIAEIAKGGMGIVYKARDSKLSRSVAIKQLLLSDIDAEKRSEYRERFRREAILAAGLNHPNLVSIYDVSISEENSYYVMEFLEGHSLRQELQKQTEGRMLAEDFLPILKQIVEGLTYAHQMSLIHRDIKPENIFVLPNGTVKLTDFGIARSAEPDTSNLTKPGIMLGTLAYVSPEQLQDAHSVDTRADIYSLGVVVYEVLTGKTAFTGDGITSTLMAIASHEPPSVSEIRPDISNEVSCVVAKAMRKDADERYSSASDFFKDYEKAIAVGRDSGSHMMVKVGQTAKASTTFSPGIPLAAKKESEHITEDREKPDTSGLKPWLNVAHTRALQEIEAKSKAPLRHVATIGRPGEGKGCFLEAGVVAVKNGKSFISDPVSRCTQIFSRTGLYLGELTVSANAKNSKSDGGKVSSPSALAISNDNNIYLADANDHIIRIFNDKGQFLHDISGSNIMGPGISGLCFDLQEMLYCSDPNNGCVHVIDIKTGAWVRKVGRKGKAEGELQMPCGIAVDANNCLFIVDYFASKILSFNKAGMFQFAFGGKGTGKGLFSVPRGIAIDKTGNIYISDSLNHRVQIFDKSGNFLYMLGGKGNEAGKFMAPADLCIDFETNYLYVADKGNARVQVFEIH